MAHFKLIILALVVQTATTGRTDVSRVVGSHGQISPHHTTSDEDPPWVFTQREMKKRIFLGGNGDGAGRYLWLYKGAGPALAFWPVAGDSMEINEATQTVNFLGLPGWMPRVGEWDGSEYDLKEFQKAGAVMALQRPGGKLEVYPLPMWNFKLLFEQVASNPETAHKLVPDAAPEDLDRIILAKKKQPNQAYLEEDLDLPGINKPFAIYQPRHWKPEILQSKEDIEMGSETSYVYVFPERNEAFGSEVYFSQVKFDGMPAIFGRPEGIWFKALASERRLPPGYLVCPEELLKEFAPHELELFAPHEYMTVKYKPCTPASVPYVWHGLEDAQLREIQEIWAEACDGKPFPIFEPNRF